MKNEARFDREQGDVNTTENRRKYWERNLSGNSKKWFDEDTKYFLHYGHRCRAYRYIYYRLNLRYMLPGP